MNKSQRIYVVDDDAEIRCVLERYLPQQGFEVRSASDGSELQDVLAASRTDLIILDLGLPGDDGFTLTRDIRATSEVPIIILTGRNEQVDCILGLELGADDYITKPFNPRELLARIKAVLRRPRGVDRAEHTPADAVNAAAVTFANWEFDLVDRRLVSPSGVAVKLSNREFNLLAAFVAAPNRVLSRGELLSLSRKFGDEIFERSIDILIFRLRQKIEESGIDVQLIKTQRGAGYIFTPEVKPIRYHIMEAATTAATLEQLGSTTGVNHLLTDVVLPDGMNRRKQAEQEIQKINEDLERRVEERTAELPTAQDTLLRNERFSTLTQLTATVSNELRNPLGVIRTSAYTLRGKLTGGEPRTERMLDRIERNVVRCDRIIDELLDFTRISQLEPEPTFLDVWLEETLSEQNLPSGVVLRLALDRPNLVLSLDRDRFRRAIINVFNNACQAMIGDGNEDADSKEHTLTVRTQESAGRIDVIFLDTGPGIPLDVYKRIFEPLYSTKGFGVGLGLPAVKHIMEQHGGGIEIESEEGCGTRVCLWLPNSPSAH